MPWLRRLARLVSWPLKMLRRWKLLHVLLWSILLLQRHWVMLRRIGLILIELVRGGKVLLALLRLVVLRLAPVLVLQALAKQAPVLPALEVVLLQAAVLAARRPALCPT